MKVLATELVSSNKRERVSGGVYIEFITEDNVKKDDYFRVNVGESEYDFQATGIKVEDDKLRISAKEVGYWASKLDHKGIDLRTVINCDVISIVDIEDIKKINERSCWC